VTASIANQPVNTARSYAKAQKLWLEFCAERQFDDGFGVRPWHQGFCRELQWQAPEFPAAEKPRHRLARQTAAREIFQARRLFRRDSPARRNDQAGEIKPEHRDVITMRFIEGYAAFEVAQLLGKTEGAIRTLQHRALERLREICGSEEEFQREARSVFGWEAK